MKSLVVAAAVVAVVVVGCGAAGDAPRASGTAGRPEAASTPTAASTDSASSRCPRGSLEGCFGYAQMDAYLAAVEPMVAQFFAEKYPRLRQPRDVVYVPSGRLARGYCGPSDSAAYEYCPANQTVYVGQDLLWSFYRRQGDAAPVIALAHEFGHHLQVMLRVPNPRTSAQSVVFENQADCIAGAFAQYADSKGWLESDDLGDIEGLLRAVGSRESRNRDHGTVAERTQAFQLGFKSGASGCNSYFPGTPVA